VKQTRVKKKKKKKKKPKKTNKENAIYLLQLLLALSLSLSLSLSLYPSLSHSLFSKISVYRWTAAFYHFESGRKSINASSTFFSHISSAFSRMLYRFSFD